MMSALTMMSRLGVVVMVVVMVTAVPIKKVEITGTTSALLYLSRFGYMDPAATNPSNSALLSEATVRNAIIDFQAFAGLNMTGYLDPMTREMMNMKRCGNKDIIGHGVNTRRKKRYALQGSRWRVRHLKYRVTKFPVGLPKGDVLKEVAIAFKVWSDVSNLTFEAVTSGKVNIEIRFETEEHGDGDPFDGRGGTLAHAYFPIYGGDAHFDDAEDWTINSYTGTNLFQVAAHEFGHSLGLSHSDVRSSLMAPFYRGYERTFKLDDDDTRAIQILYGPKDTGGGGRVTAPPPGSPATPRPTNTGGALCRDSRLDAIVTMEDKNTYVFKGSQYWKLTDDSVAVGYPKSITQNWGGMPSNINAAFTWTNGKTYFFKDHQYWRFTEMSLDNDYPKSISKGFAGIPDFVDAAFVWSGNGKIYFFKGAEYWKFDPTQRPPVKETYPKSVSNWDGIPNNVDDALQYNNGYTYFFQGGRYWRFNDRAFEVDSADPPFPRPAGQWWFGCSTSGQTMHEDDRAHMPQSTDDDVNEDSFDADGPSQGSNPYGNSIDGRMPSGGHSSYPQYQGQRHNQGHDQVHHRTDDAAARSTAISLHVFSLIINARLLVTLALLLIVAKVM